MRAARDRPQNESARYNLAHPFSHDRSFILMFEQRSLHPPAGPARPGKCPPERDGCRFRFVITERPYRCSCSGEEGCGNPFPFGDSPPPLKPLT